MTNSGFVQRWGSTIGVVGGILGIVAVIVGAVSYVVGGRIAVSDLRAGLTEDLADVRVSLTDKFQALSDEVTTLKATLTGPDGRLVRLAQTVTDMSSDMQEVKEVVGHVAKCSEALSAQQALLHHAYSYWNSLQDYLDTLFEMYKAGVVEITPVSAGAPLQDKSLVISVGAKPRSFRVTFPASRAEYRQYAGRMRLLRDKMQRLQTALASGNGTNSGHWQTTKKEFEELLQEVTALDGILQELAR